MKKILFFFLFTLFLNNNAYASVKEKILENFKKIDNLNFNFIQTINGKDEHGNCTIKYPKKIYCSYKFRYKKILVSNGKSVVIKTDQNRQYYRYSLRSTPLNLILDKNFLIKKISQTEGKMIDKKHYNFSIQEGNNLINIFFDNKNYNLIGWQTEDIYQNLAVTYIYDLKINEKINSELFNLPKMH